MAEPSPAKTSEGGETGNTDKSEDLSGRFSGFSEGDIIGNKDKGMEGGDENLAGGDKEQEEQDEYAEDEEGNHEEEGEENEEEREEEDEDRKERKIKRRIKVEEMHDYEGRLDKFIKYCKNVKAMFSGHPSEHLHEFIEDVEAGKDLHRLSDEQLIKTLRVLLGGDALKWYRGAKTQFSTWAKFKQLILSRFAPEHQDDEIRDNIYNRTQEEGTELINFITEKKCSNQSLSNPIDEQSLLKIIVRRMSPIYKSRLGTARHSFQSISELERSALRCDEELKREGQYRRNNPPPHRQQNQRPPYRNVSSVDPRPPAEPFKCWNCGEVGHGSRDCRKPKIFKCYQCGKQGHRKFECPEGNSRGSGRRGNESDVSMITRTAEEVIRILDQRSNQGNS